MRLSLDPTLQSPARSRPHFAHTRPLSASNEQRELQVATRPNAALPDRATPSAFPAFFLTSQLPAPSSGLQLSPKACLQVRKTGTALPDASLDSAAAHPPDAQSRHKFIRCHRSDYRKYGGILRYESCGSGCLCSRVEVEAVPVLVVTEYGVLERQSSTSTIPSSIPYSSIPTICPRTPSWHKYPRVVCLYLTCLISSLSLDLDRYEVPASSFPPSLSHSISSALLHSSISLPRALPLSPLPSSHSLRGR